MLILRTELKRHDALNYKLFTCEGCDYDIKFLVTPPMVCDNCLTHITRTYGIIKNLDGRYLYYMRLTDDVNY